MTGVLELSAVAAVRALRRREISPLELLDAVAERLAAVEPLVNAVPVTCLDRARAHAARLMSGTDRAAPDGSPWLAGLPVTVKDVVDVAGVPTTFGAPVCAGDVASRSDPLVRRLRRRGAIVIGKTNVPEFLAGADTVNPLFGRTRNPWDPALSCGASSGGAAVSVATGTAWCAHAEDTAGSIRIPAALCGTVGLRPTPGLVPVGMDADPVPGLSVHGPIARDVADATLFFEAMLGARPMPAVGGRPMPATGARPMPAAGGRRIAFSVDLGGTVPVDAGIAAVCTRAVEALAAQGYQVDAHAPPSGDAHEACLTLLAHRAWIRHGARVARWGDRIGAAVRAEVRAGEGVPPERLAWAHRVRAEFARSVAVMFDGYDVFVTATVGVPPWPVGGDLDPFPDPAVLAGIAAAWPLTTLAAMAGCPAVTVPCGRTAAGHPVGLQLIGPPLHDLALLRTARAVELIGGPAPPRPLSTGPCLP